MGTASATVDRATGAGAPPGRPRTRRVALGLAVGALVLVASALSAWAFLRYRGADSMVTSRATIRTRAQAFAEARWERHVLRGAPVDGDAVAAQRAAIAALSPLPTEPLDRFRERAEAGDAFADLQALVAEKRAALDALRSATQLGWTRLSPALTDPSAANTASDVAGVATMSAWKLLLAGASSQDAGECLRTCADVIRLGQDRHAGDGMVGAMIGAVAIDLAAPVALRCAARATPAELHAAALELQQLAREAPPFGPVLELEDLQMGFRMLELHDAVPAFPTSGEEVDRFLQRFEVVQALEVLFQRPAWTSELPYPMALDRIREMSEARFRSTNVFVSLTASPTKFVERHASATAKLRALAVGVEGATSGPSSEAVKSSLQYDELADPFTGRPLLIEEDASTWRIVSRGVDAGDAADDVVLTVPRAR